MTYLPYSRTQAAIQNLGLTLRDIAGMEVQARSSESAHNLKLAELGIKRAEIKAGQETGLLRELSAQRRAEAENKIALERRDIEKTRATSKLEHEKRLEGIQLEQAITAANKLAWEKRQKEPLSTGFILSEALENSGVSKEEIKNVMNRHPYNLPGLLNIPMTREHAPDFFDQLQGMTQEYKEGLDKLKESGVKGYERYMREEVAIDKALLSLEKSDMIGDDTWKFIQNNAPGVANFFGEGKGKIPIGHVLPPEEKEELESDLKSQKAYTHKKLYEYESNDPRIIDVTNETKDINKVPGGTYTSKTGEEFIFGEDNGWHFKRK